MAIIRNNHVFKGHKTFLGQKFVTYGEVELPVRYDIYPQSKSGFDWGYNGSAAIQLAFSMLYQLSNEEFAKANAAKFTADVIKNLNPRDWVLSASEVHNWIEKHTDKPVDNEVVSQSQAVAKPRISVKRKLNVVKEVCKELGITQKQLAEILEVPEGTVSSWAVKNEIPRLGKKAIEFYVDSRKNQEIVDSYKNFMKLLQHAS